MVRHNQYYAMKLKVDGIEMMQRKNVALAAFGRPLDAGLVYCRDKSFSTARCLAEGGMGWVWGQWLVGVHPSEIRNVIEPFVSRGMEIQERMQCQRMRGLHDLYLVHCAIYASSEDQLNQLAERIVDAAGTKGETPRNDGNLYASAWSGMLKHWILGNKEEAFKQSEIIWNAYRPPYFRATTKPLVVAWLSENWKSFVVQQNKDFEKLWNRANKDGTTTSKKHGQVTVNIAKFPVGQLWCWAHCGLAMLARRRGVEVATDPFWFPPNALTSI